MMNHTQEVLDEISNFVGIPSHNYTVDVLNNKYHEGVKAEMDASTRDFLRRFYKPYNNELADLLGEEWRDVWY
eukprot:scaffold2997_cov182-Amphora_coffeaeformis.AAC.10